MFVNIECNSADEPSCLVITLCVKYSRKFLTFRLLKGGKRCRKKYLFVIKNKKLFILSILSFPTPSLIKIELVSFGLLFFFFLH